MISGFVQFAIQEGLTPIPDYNSENTLMVTNGVSRDIKVSSSYWINNKLPGDDYENNISIAQVGFQDATSISSSRSLNHQFENSFKYCSETACSFDVNTTYTRTPTFDWFNEYNEHGNYELKIIDSKLGFPVLDFCVSLRASAAPSPCKGAPVDQLVNPSKDSKEYRYIVNPAASTKLLMGRSSDESLACKMKDGTYGSNNCQKCADGIIQTKLYAITNVVFHEDQDGKIGVYQVKIKIANFEKNESF